MNALIFYREGEIHPVAFSFYCPSDQLLQQDKTKVILYAHIHYANIDSGGTFLKGSQRHPMCEGYIIWSDYLKVLSPEFAHSLPEQEEQILRTAGKRVRFLKNTLLPIDSTLREGSTRRMQAAFYEDTDRVRYELEAILHISSVSGYCETLLNRGCALPHYRETIQDLPLYRGRYIK